MNGRLPPARRFRSARPRAQFNRANKFKPLVVRNRRGSIVAGKRVVICDTKRLNALANGEANEIAGLGRAVGPVRMRMEIDQLFLLQEIVGPAYLLGAEYMSATRKLR